MKILAAADLHGNAEDAERLAKRASKENVDFVVLAGDLIAMSGEPQGVIHPFVERGQKVLLLPGNWESEATLDFLTRFYGALSLHDYSLYLGDTALFGSGAANVGVFAMPETAILKHLKKNFAPIKHKKKKIMVTHTHPAGTLMAQLSNFVPGSTGVREAIQMLKPDLAICSHVHEAEGLEEQIGSTKVINVGSKGKIIEI